MSERCPKCQSGKLQFLRYFFAGGEYTVLKCLDCKTEYDLKVFGG